MKIKLSFVVLVYLVLNISGISNDICSEIFKKEVGLKEMAALLKDEFPKLDARKEKVIFGSEHLKKISPDEKVWVLFDLRGTAFSVDPAKDVVSDVEIQGFVKLVHILEQQKNVERIMLYSGAYLLETNEFLIKKACRKLGMDPGAIKLDFKIDIDSKRNAVPFLRNSTATTIIYFEDQEIVVKNFTTFGKRLGKKVIGVNIKKSSEILEWATFVFDKAFN